MTNEEDSEEVIDFTFVPVRAVIETAKTGNGGSLIGVGLDANAGVVAYGKEVVDNFKTLITGREVNSGNI